MDRYSAIATHAKRLKARDFIRNADPATELRYFQIAQQDIEGWSGRELARRADTDWPTFERMIGVSMKAMAGVGFEVEKHFTYDDEDWKLSRSAAAIALANCNPKNPAVLYMRRHFQ